MPTLPPPPKENIGSSEVTIPFNNKKTLSNGKTVRLVYAIWYFTCMTSVCDQRYIFWKRGEILAVFSRFGGNWHTACSILLKPEEETYEFLGHCYFYSIHSFFQVIVTPLKEGQNPGNPADATYEKVTRTYDDQVEGEPYITAEFHKVNAGSTFTVGDGKYYSRAGIFTEAKRKRRALPRKLAIN